MTNKTLARDERPVGIGLWSITDDERVRLVVRDVGAFETAIGSAIVAGFSRLLFAVDRLSTLLYLVDLNRRDVPARDGRPETAHAAESLARERGDFYLVTATFAAFQEATHAIGALEKAGLGAKLTEPEAVEAWGWLQAFRARWLGDDERKIRNELVAHLGFQETHEAGLAAFRDDVEPDLVIFESDRSLALAGTRFHLGANLALRGAELDLEAFKRIAAQAEDDLQPFVDSAFRCFAGLLHGAGADFPSAREMKEHEEGREHA
jgi:hypothetical protein